MSGYRLLRLLAGVAVLLFVCAGVAPRGRGRYNWKRWAKWSAVAAFSAAICYALAITLLWAVAASR